MTLNSVCDQHDHEPGLPDRELRLHVLASAIRTVQADLEEHGYPDPERAAEVLHVALEDGLDDAIDEPDDIPQALN